MRTSLPDITGAAGRATKRGTRRFAERHRDLAKDFYRPIDDVVVSSIGLGTYLGECTTEDDDAYTSSAMRALEQGINIIDTSINYRCQRSERAIGRALAQAISRSALQRDEVVICTKGGYIPLDGAPPDTREEYDAFVQREYLDRGLLAAGDIVAGGHALTPAYLADQIARSRANLGVQTIDIYYVHNPEQQLEVIAPEMLRERLRAAFELLESKCDSGEIVRYGCATWNGLRTEPGARGHLSLVDLVALAKDVAGDAHHFRVVQLPINLAMNEAVRMQTQPLASGEPASLLQCAAELGVSVVGSATLLQAKLSRGLPAQIREALPGHDTDAQRAIAFVRSLPVVASALVGMKSEAHLTENLRAGR